MIQNGLSMARRMALNFSKLCALILFGTVAYNEYLVYYVDYYGKYVAHIYSLYRIIRMSVRLCVPMTSNREASHTSS